VYNSDKIQQILSSPEGKKFLDYISPIYDEAYIALWIFQAVGLQFDDLETWTEDFIKQVVPQTATWSLPYWEAEYKIPANPSLSITQRRNTLIAKLRTRMPVNPYRIALIAKTICGCSCRVVENTAKNTFQLYISAPGSTGIDEAAIKTAVRQLKPRLICEIKYEQFVSSNLYAAFAYSEGVIFTGKQVN
jgi:hypothetical protein